MDMSHSRYLQPVPVITQEVTNALEELIKKRILDVSKLLDISKKTKKSNDTI